MQYTHGHLGCRSRYAIRLLIYCLVFVTALIGVGPNGDVGLAVRAESNEATAVRAAFGIEYAVPNGPYNLAEEAPGRIWYTSLDADGLGFLEVISSPDEPTLRYRTDFYGFGEGARPYDLVYHDGFVWFTLNGRRSLGKIDVETREITTYPLLSFGALPTGIDVDPTGKLWIAQNNGRISSFDPTTEEFTEYIMPDSLTATPRIEDIDYYNERNIWFTMPDANLVVKYDAVRGRFGEFPVSGGVQPQHIVATGEVVWITAFNTSNIGVFFFSTLTTWLWYDTPTPDSGPAGLLLINNPGGLREVWFTENKTGSIGRLQLYNGYIQINSEKIGPHDPPGNTWGIIQSANGNIWVADRGRNLLYELVSPYIHRVYIASVKGPQAE
jgi:streptogramin lyase